MMRAAAATRAVLVFVLVVCAGGCSRTAPTAPPPKPEAERSQPASRKADPARNDYTPPTAEEMAPIRPEYLVELAKIHEPPEMADKPMQVRRAVPRTVLRIADVISAVGSPDMATHEQRANAIHELLELTKDSEPDDGTDRVITYGAIATIACIDSVDPQTVIEYASNAIGDDDGALALRARMYLKKGDSGKALDDLEKVMADGQGSSLVSGDIKPRRESVPCGWSIADLDALGNDPRALAAKGLYLSSFIAYNAEATGAVKESTIRDLYRRSAISWHSPIPHFLTIITLEGLASELSMSRARCIGAKGGGGTVPYIVKACAQYDQGTSSAIRSFSFKYRS